jgi:glycosyltransferase involved in cell wall biosynthesis
MTISLIIPCFNEELNIQKGVLDKIGNYTKNDGRFIEILIVDDGSTDESKQIIKDRYLNQFPKFKLVENKHGGKAFAVITGIKQAKGDLVMFSDMDLATPLEESERLIDGICKGSDVVIGSRSTKREGAPIMRKVMALGFVYIRNILIGLSGIKDTQCGFKAFKKEVANAIVNKLQVFKMGKGVKESSVSAGFDLEFLFLASRLGYRIKETPVVWHHVETKNVNFFKDSVETIKDILLIKYYDIAKRYES